MHYIGKIDKGKIGAYRNKIVSDSVVLTNERKAHIYNNHPKDYEKIIRKYRQSSFKTKRNTRRFEK